MCCKRLTPSVSKVEHTLSAKPTAAKRGTEVVAYLVLNREDRPCLESLGYVFVAAWCHLGTGGYLGPVAFCQPVHIRP